MAVKTLKPNWIAKRHNAVDEIHNKPSPTRRAYLAGYINAYEGRQNYNSNLLEDRKTSADEIKAYLGGIKDSVADGVSSGNGLVDGHRLVCEQRDRRVTQAFFDGLEIGYARLLNNGPPAPSAARAFASTAAEQRRREPSYTTPVPNDMNWPYLTPDHFEAARNGLRKARGDRRAAGLIELMQGMYEYGVNGELRHIIEPRDVGVLVTFAQKENYIGGLQFMHRYISSAGEGRQSCLQPIETALAHVTDSLLGSANHLAYAHHSTMDGEYRARGRLADVQRPVEQEYDYKDAEVHGGHVGCRLFLVFNKLTGWCALPLTASDLNSGIPLTALEHETKVPAAYLPPARNYDVSTKKATPDETSRFEQLLAECHARDCETRQKLFDDLKRALPHIHKTKAALEAN